MNIIRMPDRTGATPEVPPRTNARVLAPAPLLFALIFSIVWLMHARLLRLPYFWDEAGYFIPAARDLLLTGDPIPTSTVSNAHPPLVMAWLAFWWKFSNFTPAVTRTAMLLVAAFALLGVFRLARQVANVQVAAAATALTALYPVFFAQSSLAHLDLAAAAFTLWGLAAYLRGHRWRATIFFAFAGLAKETALITPVALVSWEIACSLMSRQDMKKTQGPSTPLRSARDDRENAGPSTALRSAQDDSIGWCLATSRGRSLLLLISLLPLAGWLAYHYARTGIVFGNPEYFRYNVGATLNPLRIGLALLQRLWQLFAYLNMFVLAGAAALARRQSPRWRSEEEHPQMTFPAQRVFAVVIAAYLLMLSVVGGAVLARYLLPVYPLVIIVCVATLWRRVSWWPLAVGIAAAGFVIGLFVYPPYRIAPEDNLAYADYVRLHKSACTRLAAIPNARVLTAWPATDELRYPYLGYVQRPVPVVPVENFTVSQITGAPRHGSFNYAFLFPTKYEPSIVISPPGWQRLQERFFDYHRDAAPQVAAALLGGDIIEHRHRGGEWTALVAMRPDTAPPPVQPPRKSKWKLRQQLSPELHLNGTLDGERAMTWMHISIAVGYVLVLLSSLALLHGAALVYKDLRQRRTWQGEQTGGPKPMAAKRA